MTVLFYGGVPRGLLVSMTCLFYGGVPDLWEWDGHGVDCGDDSGVHEVDGVGVEEDGGAPHRHAHYHRPEGVLEACDAEKKKDQTQGADPPPLPLREGGQVELIWTRKLPPSYTLG